MQRIRRAVAGPTTEEAILDHTRTLRRKDRDIGRESRRVEGEIGRCKTRIRALQRKGNLVAATSEARKCAMLERQYEQLCGLSATTCTVQSDLKRRQLEFEVMQETAKATLTLGGMSQSAHPLHVQHMMHAHARAVQLLGMSSEALDEGVQDAYEVDEEDTVRILGQCQAAVDMGTMERLDVRPVAFRATPPEEPPSEEPSLEERLNLLKQS